MAWSKVTANTSYLRSAEIPRLMQRTDAQPFGSVQIWHADEDHLQASLGRLFLLHAIGGAKHEQLSRLIQNVDSFAALAPGAFGFLFQFIGNNARPPDEADRKLVMNMIDRYASRIAGLAVCMPSGGFVGAALRSVVSAVFVLNRPKYPVKTFGEPREAGSWLASQMDMPVAAVATLSDFGFHRFQAPG